jgi:hypothetical protein
LKNLIVAIFFCIPVFASSQNWCPTGAKWYYGHTNWFITGYITVEYTGDTIINSTTCNKLLKTFYYDLYAGLDFDTTILGTEFTYTDSNKVYIFKHNQFYTLNDFSANVGDTWTVPETGHYDGCDSIGIIRVDSIGTININNMNLRYICVSLSDTTQTIGWYAKS